MPTLRRHWLLLAIVFAACLLAGFRLLGAAWLLPAAGVGAWQLFVLYRHLPLNRRAGKAARLRPGFGPGVWLSALRLVSLSLLAGFLALPRPGGQMAWLPFGLALLFNLSDLFDGYLARRTGSATQLGAKLDLDLDARGMLVLSLLLVHYGIAPWPFVLTGWARYLYAAALWLHRRSGQRLCPAPSNALRRPFAGVQMGVATGALAPLFAPPATLLVTALTLLPFLGHFLCDWLVVTGRWRKSLAKGTNLRTVAEWAAVLLRVLVAGVLLQRAFTLGLASLFASAGLAAGLYLLAGFAGRPVAMLALIHTAARLHAATLTLQDAFLLAGALALMYLGMGRWQTWQPERELLVRRLGEKRK